MIDDVNVSNLSTITSIERDVDFNSNGYSTTNTLGSFINNREFMNGFVQYINGKDNSNTFIWKCLSATGEDIGDTLYKNIKNYIDYVSNVETCKIQALKSMMKMFGFDYTIFDNIDNLPLEVLNLMNVISIDKKHILKNKYLSDAFLNDMIQLSVVVSSDANREKYYDLSALSSHSDISEYSATTLQIDDIKYQEYIEGLYLTLLSDFCTLEYNQTPKDQFQHFYIYKTITDDDLGIMTSNNKSQYDTDIQNFIKLYSIDTNFDYKKIVDDIDNGSDNLENYQFPLSSLLQLEINKRQAKVSLNDLKMSTDDHDISGVSETESIENKTRYSYYRKQKVIEYINFINNKYYIDNITSLSSKIYQIDENYIEASTTGRNYVFDIEHKELHPEVIKSVAKSLAIATQYICKLREKLKLQVRKTYMKGTQNLLLYIINEYLIDYAKHKSQTIELSSYKGTEESRNQVKQILSLLSSHGLSSMEVIEYYDETQYYNLSTGTSDDAINGYMVNDKFWTNIDMTSDDGMSYKLNQIDTFYRNVMNMKNQLTDITDVADFLSTLFDVGADESYCTDDNLFSVRLSSHNNVFADKVYLSCIELSNTYEEFNKYIEDREYEFPKTTLSNQIENAVDFISSYLSSEKLSGVSDVANEYNPRIEQLCSEFQKLNTQYYDFLSGDMKFYFEKSNNKYCYNESEEGIKTYKHDYYLNNPIYSNEDGYLLYELQNFRNFLDASVENSEGQKEYNIVNYPLIDTITAISNECYRISSEYKSEVAQAILLSGLSGFYDINALTLDDELQSGYDYLKDRIDRRFKFLQDNLAQVRAQANQVRELYNSVKENFALAFSSYKLHEGSPSLNDPIYEIGNQTNISDKDKIYPRPDGKCVGDSDGIIKNNVLWYQYNTQYGAYFAQLSSNDGFTGDFYFYKHPAVGYDENAPIETRIDAFIKFQDTPNACVFYTPDGKTVKVLSHQYGLKQEGSYNAAVQCKQNIEQIKNQTDSIIDQVSIIGGNFDKSITYNSLDDKITALVEYISTRFNEGCFENDELILMMRKLMSKITDLTLQYNPIKSDFEQLRSDPIQSHYLGGLTANSLTFDSLREHLEYAKQRDDENRASLKLKEEQFENDLNDLYTKYSDIASQLQHLTYEWQYKYNRDQGIPYEPYVDQSSGIIEIGLSDSYNFLNNPETGDIALKTNDGNAEISRILDIVNQHLDIIKTYIGDSLQTNENFIDVIESKIDSLDIFKDEQYKEKQQIFMTYGGRDFCYYPYYNHLNITHPSYQIHPFLWNFIAKDQANFDTLLKVFSGYKVSNLSDGKIQSTVDKYYGEFGQSIGEWLDPEAYDYSGYTTRYESSNHTDQEFELTSDIIDYEGAFYPPAVEYLNNAISLGKFKNCLDSLVSAVTFDEKDLKTNNRDILNANINDIIEISSNTDSDNIVSSYSYVKDLSIYNKLCPQIDPFVVTFDLSSYIDRYFQKNLTNVQIKPSIMYDFIESLANDVEKTFYSRYYRHLGLFNNKSERQYLADQISVYYPLMSSDILLEHDISDSYDIYKHGYDSDGNTYVLFKQYFKNDPTYKYKKNTVGTMWMRYKDHPFAFPLFTGTHPIADMENVSNIPILIQELAEISGDYKGYVENGKLCSFYDFEISKDKHKLFLISRICGEGISKDSEVVQQYENPWISICDTKTVQLQSGIKKIRLTDDTYDNYCIRSGKSKTHNPSLSVDPTDTAISNYAFLGTYLRDNIATGFVYANKSYLSSGNELLGDVIVHLVIEGDNTIENTDYQLTGNSMFTGSYGDQVVFSYDDEILTFAYLKNKDMTESWNDTLGISVELSTNTIGNTYSDPRTNEMNSHDVFTNDIALVQCNIRSNSISKLSEEIQPGSKYNMNADMSLIPSYPGECGKLNIYKINSLKSNIKHGIPIELLGNSRNINQQIAMVNDDVDPYADFSSLSDNFAFGRVYEDYIKGSDNTYRQFKNPSINIRTNEIDDDSILQWTIDLSGYNYSEKTQNSLNIIAYNINTLGKNPYIIAGLHAITTEDDKWFTIPGYNDKYSQENSREQKIITNIDSNGCEVDATGTYSRTKFLNRTDSNHIDGIKSMQMQFNPVSKKLNVRFILEDGVDPNHVYVAKNTINVILYTTTDLHTFNYYHYLDAYGVINTLNGKIDVPDDVIGDHWTFKYDPDKIKDEIGLSSDLNKYILDNNGEKHYITDNELDKYNYLSDVYALQTNRRLSFKYSEEDIFPFDSENYYFPSLNVKYPKVLGEFITSPSCQLEKAARIVDLSNVFTDRNLFILDLYDYDVSSNFGRVEIELLLDDPDSLEGFEKYTEFINTDESISTISDDFNKFDPYDARSMFQVDFTEFETNNIISVNQIVDRIFNNKKYYDTEKFINELNISANQIIPFGLEHGSSKMIQSVAFDVNKIDLTEFMRLYVNYNKTDSGIVLYFNYYNYLNTPFIRIEDGKTYPDYIDNTFCRISQGETSYVDIVIQLKYYVDNVLNGYKNVTLASYKVTNISDDKPKFILQEVSRLTKDDFRTIHESPNVTMIVRDSIIDLSNYTDSLLSDTHPQFNLYVDIESDRRLSSPYWIGVNYPYELAQPTGINGDGFVVNDSSRGYFDVEVTDTNITTLKFGLSTSQELPVKQLSNYINRYQVFIDKAYAYGQNGEIANINVIPGAIEIKNVK